MKRLLVALFAVLLLCSCGAKYEPFAYQNGDIVAKCEVNDKYIINVEKAGGERLLYISEPSELSYISFKYEGGECIARCDEMEIPLSEGAMDGIVALCLMLDLSEEDIISTTASVDSSRIEVCSGDVCYLVDYNKDSLPSHISISSDSLSIEVEILELITKSK